MTETTWLAGLDGDDMLEYVADRLTPRQWHLLACGMARRFADLLPDGPLKQAIDQAELAVKPLAPAARKKWAKQVEAAIPDAVAAAEAAQLLIVHTCDPDAADPPPGDPPVTAPALPMFHAASRHARNSVTGMGQAAEQAAGVVKLLFDPPSEDTFSEVQRQAALATETRTFANREATLALRMKSDADDAADRAVTARNKGLEEARALEAVRKLEEAARGGDDADEKTRLAAARNMGRLLKEILGNPFKPVEFSPDWRTDNALALAKGIFADRAFDRLPVLADALLDAECDAEPVLRHLRNTEFHHKEPPFHLRGCWAVELVLDRFEPLPPAPAVPRPPRRNPDDLDFGLPDLRDFA